MGVELRERRREGEGGISAFDSRILHQKGAICSRGGVSKFIHVVNNDTIMHAVHNCTVAFSTQS